MNIDSHFHLLDGCFAKTIKYRTEKEEIFLYLYENLHLWPNGHLERWYAEGKMFHYKAATFFSSFIMALLMKSLMVMPVAATKAATFECSSDDIRRLSFPL